jgi:hypothetical protein
VQACSRLNCPPVGAALNYNPKAGAVANAFNQGHNLYKLTLTTGASVTIPVFPPSCKGTLACDDKHAAPRGSEKLAANCQRSDSFALGHQRISQAIDETCRVFRSGTRFTLKPEIGFPIYPCLTQSFQTKRSETAGVSLLFV